MLQGDCHIECGFNRSLWLRVTVGPRVALLGTVIGVTRAVTDGHDTGLGDRYGVCG